MIMKLNISFLLFFLLIPMVNSNEEEKEFDEFEYSALGINFVQTDKTELGLKISIPLPGNLYLVGERNAEDIDIENDSYERIINSVRLGVHAGIGDIFSSISSNGIQIDIANIFDVYTEIGIKSTAYETDINSFSEDDSQANVIAGIRFGNPNGWEGNVFLDLSKDSEIKIKECPINQVCTEAIEYELNDKTDSKFGAGVLYNINKRSAVKVEMISSDIFDTAIKIGYQLNF